VKIFQLQICQCIHLALRLTAIGLCERLGDARGVFMADAGPVYELLGKKDLGATNFPSMGNGLD
jgi:hypothetical protein